ncbi:MAG: hypothetical protein U0269_10655 [Polyangiales bacterium]
MSGREQGKTLLKNLSSQVKEVLNDDGEQLTHKRGVEAMIDLATDLTGEDAPAGLIVQRDGGLKLKLFRKDRPGLITIEWQRPIGAIVTAWERMDKSAGPFRFVHRASDDSFIEMSLQSELYAWLTSTMGEVLYPETRKG